MQHHAILLYGTLETVSDELPEDIRMSGADVRHIALPQFGINDARSLAEEAVRRPVERAERVFVVAFNQATIEAQNALLKTLEEPAPTSRFYIVVPHESVLIHTVRSRLMPVAASLAEKKITPVAQEFINAPYGERLRLVEQHVKEKNVAWIADLLDGLEVWAHESGNMEVMQELITVRKYIERRGASKKMLLEQLALTVPNI